MLFYIRLLIALIIFLGYGWFLFKITGKDRSVKNLCLAFGVVGLLGIIYHAILFIYMTGSEYSRFADFWAIVWFSIEYSAEMFFTNSVIFKSEVLEVLKLKPGLFYAYVPLYGMAILTSAAAVFHIFSRRAYTRLWLKRHREQASDGNTHIFFGNDHISQTLAKNLEGNIIYVDLPDENDALQSFSVWDIISRFFNNKNIQIINENHVILKAEEGSSHMELLKEWLNCEKNNAYILSEDEERNLRILEKISCFKCHIYCHAKKDGLVSRYDTFADDLDLIKFVDSSYLAVEAMKKDPDGVFLPIKYVKIGKDKKGRKLGYVTTSFNCAIIGFGETGQEALKFLYEFGSFPDKKKNKSPFMCHVFDNVNREIFFENYRDVNNIYIEEGGEFPKEVENHVCNVDSPEFWSDIQKIISSLNYVVVSLGDDELNLKIALDIAEFATIHKRDLSDRFIIAVSQRSSSTLREKTVENANKAFNGCIKFFGRTEDIWTESNINHKDMEEAARLFYESYEKMTSPTEKVDGKWDERKANLKNTDCAKRFAARRGITQDFSNCLHVRTKLELCSFSSSSSADQIFDEYNTKLKSHCKAKHRSVLEYLAICEHLRWTSSHIAMGYKYSADEPKNELTKIHPSIKAYSKLDKPTKHYDWLVVKNSLKQIVNADEQEAAPKDNKSVPVEKVGYIPKPIDASGVVLPEELNELMEKMSENVHEVWAKNRMDQGWTLGEKRDDEKKTHPCLVPYSELPEIEKDYDRDTAISTLKFIIKSGYKIRKVCRFKNLLKKKN